MQTFCHLQLNPDPNWQVSFVIRLSQYCRISYQSTNLKDPPWITRDLVKIVYLRILKYMLLGRGGGGGGSNRGETFRQTCFDAVNIAKVNY